ncbi:class I SAM-dependent methyltransferase [Rhodococcus sp. Z13]|uniref:Class I SAM-dependent methyltransferase n=1 Tax=Rhodococcus sacchari TaxID=2962047 RepID=A0ACD4DDM6_9NOCA|nr:class I SAM-dependent methyltransferase [Rhodococcus sp. Z13]UYP18179.1 class I SAM-dependent methyltransferase [Rhodococcus sp. Z13]
MTPDPGSPADASTITDTTAETARTFDEASESFDELTPLVWGPAGQVLAFRTGIGPGDRVLDVCCGTGASALPAAMAAGPDGRVHAVDIADELLEHGRLVAERRGLKNIDFVCADATTWEPLSDVPEQGYDALTISYGVFFLPHMDRSFGRLVSQVRHGGRVGVTVWRAGAMEEFSDLVFDVVGRWSPRMRDRGSLRHRTPLHRIDTPAALEEWLVAAGTHTVEIGTLSNLLPATEELCWALVTGSGMRGMLAGLDDPQVEEVRQALADEVTARGLHTIDATTLVGTATVLRPPVSG